MLYTGLDPTGYSGESEVPGCDALLADLKQRSESSFGFRGALRGKMSSFLFFIARQYNLKPEDVARADRQCQIVNKKGTPP